jgi:sulfur-oxidizing protein SoxY
MNRRAAIKTGGGASVMALMVSAGLIRPQDVFAQAQEWNKGAFEAKSLNDTVKALGGMMATESKDISFVNAPDIAENGAVVPVGVQSKIAKTEMIAILVEKNPNSLSAAFMIPSGTEPTVSTRVKMGQTSNVHAVVKADGKYFYATKEIKVTLGGCGG